MNENLKNEFPTNCKAKTEILDHFRKSPRSPRFSLSLYDKMKNADFLSRTFAHCCVFKFFHSLLRLMHRRKLSDENFQNEFPTNCKAKTEILDQS